jgi:putative ABC transport system substrate-binding protein
VRQGSIRRRDFITIVGGAVAWPIAARAQQAATPVIGYLGATSAEAYTNRLRSFRQGLSDTGYVEGRNVTIEYGWANSVPGRLSELAADLVRRRVSVIVGNAPAAVAAKAATKTIPIVFSGALDPVQIGLVESLNQPGGNLTGVTSMGTEIGGKQLSLMRELLPKAMHYALLLNPINLIFGGPLEKEMQSVAASFGAEVELLNARTIGEIDSVFSSLAEKRIEALFVSPSAFFEGRRVQLTTLANRYAIPTLYDRREFVEIGGLISYGTNNTEMERQVGIYAGRILRGEKPADLPVLRATKFELVINLSTAKAIGISVPSVLLALADEVIE